MSLSPCLDMKLLTGGDEFQAPHLRLQWQHHLVERAALEVLDPAMKSRATQLCAWRQLRHSRPGRDGRVHLGSEPLQRELVGHTQLDLWTRADVWVGKDAP